MENHEKNDILNGFETWTIDNNWEFTIQNWDAIITNVGGL